MSRDYDKATEKSEPMPKGHAAAVKEAIEDQKHGQPSHPTMMPSKKMFSESIVIHFAREPLTPDLWAEAMPLLIAHKAEIAHYADIPLEPDVALYAANEQAGVLRCFTAREIIDGHIYLSPLGRLVGYALYFVRANPHYKSSVQAVQDVIYLDPSVRGGTGYKFIAWCDAQLAAEGVQAVYHHVKAQHDFGKLLGRQGYELVDLIYAKRLDSAPPSISQRLEELDEAFI